MDPLAYACPKALAARAIPDTMTELRRFGMVGGVLLLNESCRRERAGEAEDVVGPEVNVRYVSGAMAVDVEAGRASLSADGVAAAVTHSPVHSG